MAIGHLSDFWSESTAMLKPSVWRLLSEAYKDRGGLCVWDKQVSMEDSPAKSMGWIVELIGL
jgi:hypothetical protein